GKKQKRLCLLQITRRPWRGRITGGTISSHMTRRPHNTSGPLRLAIWFGKGGVGKSTTTMMLTLFAARRGQRVLTIDLDPECGTSRDFLGKELPNVGNNLKTFLESPLPVPPPILPSGIDDL